MATLKELYDLGHLKVKRKGNSLDTYINLSIHSHSKIKAFEAICDDWEPVTEKTKKSVIMMNHTYQKSDGIFETGFLSQKWEDHYYAPYYKLIKTETKTLEWDE